MELRILDVSRHQGIIDWDKVNASGRIDGVMLRALGNSAEGKPCKPYLDPTFERNYAACTRLGIPVGAYYYSKAVNQTQADAELAMLHKALEGKTLGMPVAVDVEDGVFDLVSKATLTDLVAYDLEQIQGWGVYAMLYAGLCFAEDHLYMGGAALKKYDVWLAAYRKNKPNPGWAFGMWQYTSKGRLPGISGNVDLSRAYKHYPAIIRNAGLGQVKGK